VATCGGIWILRISGQFFLQEFQKLSRSDARFIPSVLYQFTGFIDRPPDGQEILLVQGPGGTRCITRSRNVNKEAAAENIPQQHRSHPIHLHMQLPAS
jgi:hypothetical protein